MICEICKNKLSIRKEQGKNFEIYNERAELVLDNISRPVQAIITDPPYNSGGFDLKTKKKPPSEKYCNSNKYINFFGEGLSEGAWRRILTEVFHKSANLLEEGGFFAVFSDFRRLNDIIDILFSVGLPVKGVLVWDKNRCSRPIKGGFRHQTEFIIWGRKAGKKVAPPDVYLDGVVKVTTLTNNKFHPAQKPVQLMEYILKATNEGDTILDPFMGVSTTGVASLKTNRKFIGIEVVKEFFEIALNRLKEVGNA